MPVNFRRGAHPDLGMAANTSRWCCPSRPLPQTIHPPHWNSMDWFGLPLNFIAYRMRSMWSFMSGFFLCTCLWGPTVFLCIMVMFGLWWYEYTQYIDMSWMDIWVLPSLGPFWIVLLWIFSCMCFRDRKCAFLWVCTHEWKYWGPVCSLVDPCLRAHHSGRIC